MEGRGKVVVEWGGRLGWGGRKEQGCGRVGRKIRVGWKEKSRL